MFFSVCLWATTVVIDSMASIAGQAGWFKTEHPNPPIVSFAKEERLPEGDIIPVALIFVGQNFSFLQIF